jgi:hypothetical protein
MRELSGPTTRRQLREVVEPVKSFERSTNESLDNFHDKQTVRRVAFLFHA